LRYLVRGRYFESHVTDDECSVRYTRVYPKDSGLDVWSENCKWYISLPLGAVVSLFVSQSSEFCRHNPFCCFLTSVYCCKPIFRYRLSPETFGYTLVLHSRRVRREKDGRSGASLESPDPLVQWFPNFSEPRTGKSARISRVPVSYLHDSLQCR
jgi:hypothetical protein